MIGVPGIKYIVLITISLLIFRAACMVNAIQILFHFLMNALDSVSVSIVLCSASIYLNKRVCVRSQSCFEVVFNKIKCEFLWISFTSLN